MKNQEAFVLCNNSVSNCFTVASGTKQGECCLPISTVCTQKNKANYFLA